VYFKVDAQVLKKLCRVFHPGIYSISFNSHSGGPGHVRVNAYDGATFMEAFFDAVVIDEGGSIFSAEYIDRLTRVDGEVVVRYEDGGITLRDGLRPFHIPCSVPEGPYLMPENINAKGSITIELSQLKRLFNRVRFATGMPKTGGFDLNYVLREFGEYIRAVGCDRRTLAIAKVLQGSPYQGRFLLPKLGVEVISRLDGDLAVLTIYDTGIGVEVVGDIIFSTYIPEHRGNFPGYLEILKFPVYTTMTCSHSELDSILADILLHSEILHMTFAYRSYAKLPPRFRARDGKGAHVERIAGQWQGRDLKIRANARVTANAIEHISGRLTFRFSHDRGSFSIMNEEQDFIAVLQPYAPERK